MIRRSAIAVATVAVLGAAPVCAADVYRCTDVAGRVEFRDTPCAGAQASKRVDVAPNSAGTMTADELRAKTTEASAKRRARIDAEAQAVAADNEARRRAYLDERAHQDALDTQQLIRDANAPNPNLYWDGFSRRPPKVTVEVKPATPAPTKPAAPK